MYFPGDQSRSCSSSVPVLEGPLYGLGNETYKTPAQQDKRMTSGSNEKYRTPPVINKLNPEEFPKIKLQEPGSPSDLEVWTPGHYEILRYRVWRLFVKLKRDPRAKAKASDETILYCLVTKSNQEKGMGVWDFILHLQRHGLGTYTPVARDGEVIKDTNIHLPDEAFRFVVDRWYSTDYRDFTKNSRSVEVYLDHVWSFEDVIWRLNDLGFIKNPSSLEELRSRYVPRTQHQVVKEVRTVRMVRGGARCLEFTGGEAGATHKGEAGMKNLTPMMCQKLSRVIGEKEEVDEEQVLDEKKKEVEKKARKLLSEVQLSLSENSEELGIIASKKPMYELSESDESEQETDDEDFKEMGKVEEIMERGKKVLNENGQENGDQELDVVKLKWSVTEKDKIIKKKNDYIVKLQACSRTITKRLKNYNLKTKHENEKSVVNALASYLDNGKPSLKSKIEELYSNNKEVLLMTKPLRIHSAKSTPVARPKVPRSLAPVPVSEFPSMQGSNQGSDESRGSSIEHWRYHQLQLNNQNLSQQQPKQLNQFYPIGPGPGQQATPAPSGSYCNSGPPSWQVPTPRPVAYYNSGPPPAPAPSSFSGPSSPYSC